MLVFLAQHAFYAAPVNDSWFEAHNRLAQNISNSASDVTAMQLYTPANPVSVLSCVEQNWICNPNSLDGQQCVTLVGNSHVDPLEQTAGLGFNDRQAATVTRVYDPLWRFNVIQSAYYLGGSGLLASALAQDNLSPGLPDDQWRLEVQNWFATSLTALQMSMVQFVTGYNPTSFNKWVTAPTQADQWMCHNQIVQRSDYASFSVLGLILILVIGSLIIALSLGLSSVLPRIRFIKSAHKRRMDLEWRSYDLLQLRRSISADAAADRYSSKPLGSVAASDRRRATQSGPQPMMGTMLRSWLGSRQPSRREKHPGEETELVESPLSSQPLRGASSSSPISPESVLTSDTVSMMGERKSYEEGHGVRWEDYGDGKRISADLGS